MSNKFEISLAIILLVIASFLSINFVPSQLGVVYGIFAILFLFAINEKRIPFFPVFKSKPTIERVVVPALGALLLWIVVSSVIAGADAQAVISTFATQSSLPITPETSAELSLFLFGLFIPVIETLMFFGFVLPFLLQKIKLTNNKTINDAAVILLGGLVMAVFHANVRSASDIAMIFDIIFAVISAALVVNYKELAQAKLLHIMVNTIVVITALGLSLAYILGGAV